MVCRGPGRKGELERREEGMADLVEDSDGVGGDEIPKLLETGPGAVGGRLSDGLAML
jgi:hypothetical protein